jgi:hypothetical protein
VWKGLHGNEVDWGLSASTPVVLLSFDDVELRWPTWEEEVI